MGSVTALIHSDVLTVAARANWGRWIADCLLCNNARALAPGDPSFECSGCGTLIEVRWPPEETRYAVARLLMMRPLEANRNWEGEDLHQLVRENAEHGIFDRLPIDGPPRSVLTVDDLSIRRDELPPPRSLRELGE
jgi:hypothetical protein